MNVKQIPILNADSDELLRISQEGLLSLNLAEMQAIQAYFAKLERNPTDVELETIAQTWSEHCVHKTFKSMIEYDEKGRETEMIDGLFKTYIQRATEEIAAEWCVSVFTDNAGIIEFDDNYNIVFKVETHNHPSAIEPYGGAGTGIGGVIRDSLGTGLGAKPILNTDVFCFGLPDLSYDELPKGALHPKRIFKGVVAGVRDYGNRMGIPTANGAILFDSRYTGNPLVYCGNVGLIPKDRCDKSVEPDDLVVAVGGRTGRDGIHGASGLASRTFQEQAEMRSAVQVGNPFLEKVLIEACLEAIELPGVVGMQDCGAAGITSAAVEMAERSDLGINIDVAKVPRREDEMSAYEVMLSESQERMLLAIKPGHEDLLFELFEKWDLDAAIIGTFESGNRVIVSDGRERISMTPVEMLTDAPEYSFNAPKPTWLAELQSFDLSVLPALEITPNDALLKLLASPNISSKHTVWRQYDHQVQNNTVIAPGNDAALLRIQGTRRALAVSTDGNGRLVYLDPRAGAAIAVAEACRNLSCVGATPLALTDGLNFGNPETQDIQYQIQGAIAGLSDAASAFGIPVVSGNASLYNETAEAAVQPTPIIGALGVLANVERHARSAFQDEDDAVILIGASTPWDSVDALSGSEALAVLYHAIGGNPEIDLDLEIRVQSFCRSLIEKGIAKSVHDVSHGGLAVSIVESAVQGGIGVKIEHESPVDDWLPALFGESQSRIVLTCSPADARTVLDAATAAGVPATRIGTVAGDHVIFSGLIDLPLGTVADVWLNSFERIMSG
jgi:phosphoribosylformylglycinamidine synthase